MDREQLATIIVALNRARSRRQVLSTATRGALAGLGAALVGRGIGGGLAHSGSAMVQIVDFAFQPATIEVAVGSSVTWTNIGARRHTVTAVDGSFDQRLAPGDPPFSHLFSTVGTYDYFCTIHPNMTGTVNVVEAPTYGQTPTPQPYGQTPTAEPPTTYVRPNVYSLDPAGPELTAYANAVAAMKALPSTDPLSWAYQANMHATWFNPPPPEPPPPSPEPPGWTTCEHFNNYFWPWHRMYLYWFERIIQVMSGDNTFALPYWNYSDPTQRILPAPFLDPSGPLYVAERDSNVNAGNPPTASVPLSIFDFCGGLSQTVYDFAASGIENAPHGGVHVWVAGTFDSPPMAGWMGAFDTAARDPVFWLHHCNIDRLWESWLALGNANPTDPTWLANDFNSDTGRPYDFFDEDGVQVTTVRVVNEVLDAVGQLGYEYEALSDLSGCPAFLMAAAQPERRAATPEATPPAPREIGSVEPAGGIEIGAEPTSVPVTLAQPEAAAAAGTTPVLTLEGVRGEGVPAVVVEVYINLPPGETPDFRSPYYVGNLNLFGLQPWDEGAHREHGATQRFNIAPNVAALQAAGEWDQDLQVTFVPYYTAATAAPEAAGATPTAAEPPPGPWATVESVSVITQ